MTSASMHSTLYPVAAEQATRERSEEVELLRRAQAGERAACETVVRRFSRTMHRTARRILRSEADSADAVQDAFLSLFRAIGSFDGHSQLKTWLQRIVVNACLMKLRRSAVRGEVLRCEPEALSELSCAPEGDAYGHLAQAQLRASVRVCIARLREPHRTVLILRDLEELDTEETAARLGISCAAVKVRLHRARLALRALLAAEEARARPA